MAGFICGDYTNNDTAIKVTTNNGTYNNFTGSNIGTSAWVKVVAFCNGTTISLYRNTTNDLNTAYTAPNNVASITQWIGSNSDSFGWFNGYIEDLKITNDNLGANWVLTEFANQNSPGTFYSTGDEEQYVPNVGGLPDGVNLIANESSFYCKFIK